MTVFFLQKPEICGGIRHTLFRSSTIEHSAQTARMVLRAEGQGIPIPSERASSLGAAVSWEGGPSDGCVSWAAVAGVCSARMPALLCAVSSSGVKKHPGWKTRKQLGQCFTAGSPLPPVSREQRAQQPRRD